MENWLEIAGWISIITLAIGGVNWFTGSLLSWNFIDGFLPMALGKIVYFLQLPAAIFALWAYSEK
jgi:hypothetical protein